MRAIADGGIAGLMEHWYPLITPRGKALKGYEVSDRGRVRSYWVKGGPHPAIGEKPRLRLASRRRVKGKQTDWLVMCLRVGHAKAYTYPVHQLVAWSCVGRRPTKRHVVIHKNHRHDDNRARNLEWVTRPEASLHSVANRPRRPLAKLTPRSVRAIRASKETAPVLAARYGVEKKAIYNIKWWNTWGDVAP